MLKATDIYKDYGNIPVIKGVSLEVNQGEVVSITGESGAGKSTLLHLMSTLDKPSSGEITFFGESYKKLQGNKLAKFRNVEIGFIFQNHQLIPELNALENVCLPAWIAKKSKSEAIKKAKELLAYFKLTERIYHQPNQLSGGEAQRVAIARALINSPKLVFADEPTGNLDSTNAEMLHQLFLEITKEFNTSFLIVTHSEKLADTCDRRIRIADGRLL